MVIRINGIPFGMTCSGNNNRSTIFDAIIKKKLDLFGENKTKTYKNVSSILYHKLFVHYCG